MIRYVGFISTEPLAVNLGASIHIIGRLENRTAQDHTFDCQIRAFSMLCHPENIVVASGELAVAAHSDATFEADFTAPCADLEWRADFAIKHLGVYQTVFQVREP